MESVRDPNVGPPDRHKVWEASSHTRFTAGPLTPPKLSPAGGIKEILPVVGRLIKSIGWLVSDNRFS